MTIGYESGDLLEAPVDALVNTVNTVGVMGKGIALQFKRRYPRNYDEYRVACEQGLVKLGRMFVTQTYEIDGPKWIINFPTKAHWRAGSRMSSIRDGLVDLKRVIEELNIQSIAVPPLGAGNGGLDWADVKPLIVDSLGELVNVSVLIYEPAKQFRPVAGHAVRLTPARALLLRVTKEYLRRRAALEPWESASGVSHLEIQKLMYFAQQAQPELKLRFSMGKYGPYSEPVRHMLQDMEGTFVSGLGDGSAAVLELHPITVTPLADEELAKYGRTPESSSMVEVTLASVLAKIEGFEGAYLLELLASVEWARVQTGSNSVELVTDFIRAWTDRKGRIFTQAHIEVALEHLTQSELLST